VKRPSAAHSLRSPGRGQGGGSTVAALLAASGLPAIEAQALAAHALGLSRARLLADPGRGLDGEAARRVERLFLRRRAGEPVAYLTGEREFFGLSLKVTPDVLIPRPETELLVELGLARLPNRAGRLLDLGTGSGAVAGASAHAAPDAEIVATDASAAALEVARENARRYGVSIRLVLGDWFAALAGERFDAIVSNPPYVAAGDAHLGEGDLRFEPGEALVGGVDGLEAIRAIVAGAQRHLVAGGWLLFEHGYDQAERCKSLLAMYGYAEIAGWPDLAGIVRVAGGRAAR
jgi:release factor glutamine methyltransferase